MTQKGDDGQEIVAEWRLVTKSEKVAWITPVTGSGEFKVPTSVWNLARDAQQFREQLEEAKKYGEVRNQQWQDTQYNYHELQKTTREAQKRVRVLEEALRAEINRQCSRCAAGLPFIADGIHACDEPTRSGEPCAGHECWLSEDLRALRALLPPPVAIGAPEMCVCGRSRAEHIGCTFFIPAAEVLS